MDWNDIVERIRQGEDESTEFKRWEAFPGGVARAMCALGNGAGGIVVLGVDDSGGIVGVPEESEAVAERLTSLLHSGLNAPVSAHLGRHATPSGDVHWINVKRYLGPEPLRYRGLVYTRRERSSVEASPGELQDLYNRFGFILTEEQVISGSGASDLDIAVFHDFLRRQNLDVISEPQPEPIADLRNRGVVADDDGAPRATVYGMLCFGRQPQSFPPLRNACISMVAYAGLDRSATPILSGDASGRLDEQVIRALGWMRALGIRETFQGAVRVDQMLVPERALREALVNAVAHRDYAILGSRPLLEVFTDRVVVTSPGELPNHMTEAAVLAGGLPRSRNQAIANFLQVVGLMEMRGRGLPIIRKEMRDFNGATPQLENNRAGRFVRLTLPLKA